jgi:hypothetical protein
VIVLEHTILLELVLNLGMVIPVVGVRTVYYLADMMCKGLDSSVNKSCRVRGSSPGQAANFSHTVTLD